MVKGLSINIFCGFPFLMSQHEVLFSPIILQINHELNIMQNIHNAVAKMRAIFCFLIVNLF